jgi:hypothetical protein
VVQTLSNAAHDQHQIALITLGISLLEDCAHGCKLCALVACWLRLDHAEGLATCCNHHLAHTMCNPPGGTPSATHRQCETASQSRHFGGSGTTQLLQLIGPNGIGELNVHETNNNWLAVSQPKSLHY